MKKIAVFPGSFDPFTKGHENIVGKALCCFDQVIIGIGVNDEKKPLLSGEQRQAIIETIYEDEERIVVEKFHCLTVDFCKQMQASYIVRGLRDVTDFCSEQAMFIANKELFPSIETVFFMSEPEFAVCSSHFVRTLINHKAQVLPYLPDKFPIEILRKITK